MPATVWGVVKNGSIVPNTPLPEGTRVEIRPCEAPAPTLPEASAVDQIALADFYDPVDFRWDISTWEVREALRRYSEEADADR